MPSGDEEYDPWHLPLLCIFGASVAIAWIYSYSKWKNLISSVVSTRLYTDRPQEKAGKIKAGLEPHVTIQICTYNEGEVVKATIDHACMVRWPKNKLTIHVLDDSTDPHSTNIVSDRVAHWRECGMDIRQLRRSGRVGFKAGSLRYHFESIESDFVAHFDADHQMEPDFLVRTMGHFFDKKGNDLYDVGLVQAPWGYYNIHRNLLTETDAFALDVHHVIEQIGRAHSYGVFGFNGTGGVWRKAAIRDAGGWTWDSVTEDLAISYLAYEKGYRFVYVRDIPQLLEVPANFLAHIQQKTRWTKGFFQVFRGDYWGIFTSPNISPNVKLEAFLHITGSLEYAAILSMFLVYPYLMLHGIDGPISKFAPLVAFLEPALGGIITCFAKTPGRNSKRDGSIWGRAARLRLVLPFVALNVGRSLFETKGIFEGLFSNDATFLTTPKKGSSNAVKRRFIDDFTALGGIVIGIHRMAFLVNLDAYHEPTLYNRFFLLMNMFLCAAFFWVNGGFLLEKYKPSKALTHGRCRPWPRSKILFRFLPTMLSLVFVWGGVRSPEIESHLLKNAAESVQPKRGVYFLANDMVLDLAIAYLNSFRHFNPTIPLALIPYDDDYDALNALADEYEFTVYFEPKLFHEIDQLSKEWIETGLLRKLAIWDGPFDEFLYMDVDSVILDSVDFAFPLLEHADVLGTNSNYPQMKQWVWEDTIDDSGLLTPEQIAFSMNAGCILSSKPFASSRDLIAKTLKDGAIVRKHGAKIHDIGLKDQTLLNYLFVSSGKRYSSFTTLAYEKSLPVDLKMEAYGGAQHQSLFVTEDNRIGKYHDTDHPVFFLHWAGPKCNKQPSNAVYCDVWNYWRNFGKQSNIIHLKQEPFT